MRNSFKFKNFIFLIFIIQLFVFNYDYPNELEFENNFDTYELFVGNSELNNKNILLEPSNFQKIRYGTTHDERPFKDRLIVRSLKGCIETEVEPEGAIVLQDRIKSMNYVSPDFNPEIVYMDSVIPQTIHDLKVERFLRNLTQQNIYQKFSNSFYLKIDKFSKELEGGW